MKAGSERWGVLARKRGRGGPHLPHLLIWLAAAGSLAANPGDGRKEKDEPVAFELLLKRQTYAYVPYEYTSFTTRSNYSEFYAHVLIEKLKQNQKVLVPAVLSYEDREAGFRAEISYYEMELANPNAVVTRSGPQSYSVSRHYFSPMARSEFEAVIFKMLAVTSDSKFLLGGGLRNINKYIYGNDIPHGAYQEYLYTYGPQASAKTVINVADNISLNLGIDLFYSTGTRFLQNRSVSLTSISLHTGTAETRGIYRGCEVDFSVSWAPFARVKLYAGYSHIYSFFSYLHYHQLTYTVTNYASPGAVTSSLVHSVRSGNHETITGLYLGMGVPF